MKTIKNIVKMSKAHHTTDYCEPSCVLMCEKPCNDSIIGQISDTEFTNTYPHAHYYRRDLGYRASVLNSKTGRINFYRQHEDGSWTNYHSIIES